MTTVKKVITRKKNCKLEKYRSTPQDFKRTSMKMSDIGKRRIQKHFGEMQTAINLLSTAKGCKALKALVE